ncbi:hypothetical protein D3C84_1227870 [compost metagenome]
MSAPVFHRVMEGALRLMDVPPDDIEQWFAAQAKREAPKVTAAATAAPAASPPATVNPVPEVLR